MKIRFIFPVLLILSILVGCAPVDSLNPLFADKDAIFDPALVGHWGDPAKNGSINEGDIEFIKAGENGYRIVMADKDGGVLEYQAHLAILQGHRFLDVVPDFTPKEWANLPDAEVILADSGNEANRSADKSGFKPPLVRLDAAAYLEFAASDSPAKSGHFKLRIRRGHWFCKVSVVGPDLYLNCLDPDWLGEQIDEGKIKIDHTSAASGHEGIVLTANTEDLQRFVVAHADDEKAFSSSMTVKRFQIKDAGSAEDIQ